LRNNGDNSNPIIEFDIQMQTAFKWVVLVFVVACHFPLFYELLSEFQDLVEKEINSHLSELGTFRIWSCQISDHYNDIISPDFSMDALINATKALVGKNDPVATSLVCPSFVFKSSDNLFLNHDASAQICVESWNACWRK